MATRRGFLQALGAFLVAHKLPAPVLWRDADFIYRAPAQPVMFHSGLVIEDDIIDVKNVVIGAWAQYWPPVEFVWGSKNQVGAEFEDAETGDAD